MTEKQYVGDELALFAQAHNWKSYYGKQLHPFVGGTALEVGSGLGGTTAWLRSGRETSWTCLEPDPTLAEESRRSFTAVADVPTVVAGTLADLDAALRFQTILYIDVLEHIDDDRSEMEQAAERLTPGGHLIVLSPAFNLLYSEFDRQIGHYRRYTKASLQAVVPASLERVKLVYLDAVGMLLSLGNRFLLRAGQPSQAQIRLWDRRVVPLSAILDPLLGWRLGKTVVGVWRR